MEHLKVVLETKFKAFITSKELGIGAVLPLFRFLVTGAVMGPSMFEIAVFLGKEECIQRMEEGIAIERLYQMAFNVAQVNPQIMDNIDHDAAVRLRANLLGVPKSIID